MRLHWFPVCLLCLASFMDAQTKYDRDIGYTKEQRRLIRHLTNMKEQDPRARPVHTADQPINVTVRMNLYQIIDVEERNQFIIIYAWMTQMWKDITLRYDPSEYDNITMIVVPYTEIWLPDTYLYNNVEMVRGESERLINAIVEMYPDDPEAALVTLRYPALYKFTCSLDVTYFPFDIQICVMVFGSWTYDSSGIDFFPEDELVATEDFSESEEWDVISFKALGLGTVLCRIIPSVIISVISTVGFFAPATTTGQRTEKVTLGIATLLAFAILLLMVADQMPSTSRTVPLIGWFLLGIMAETAMGTLGSAMILVVHNLGQNGKRVPPLIRRVFFSVLAPIFGVDMPPKLEPKVISDLPPGFLIRSHDSGVNDVPRSQRYRDYQRERRKSRLSITGQTVTFRNNRPVGGIQIRVFGGTMNEDEIAYLEYEWLAEILDRVTLTFTLTGVCAITIATLAIGYGHAN